MILLCGLYSVDDSFWEFCHYLHLLLLVAFEVTRGLQTTTFMLTRFHGIAFCVVCFFWLKMSMFFFSHSLWLLSHSHVWQVRWHCSIFSHCSRNSILRVPLSLPSFLSFPYDFCSNGTGRWACLCSPSGTLIFPLCAIMCIVWFDYIVLLKFYLVKFFIT